MSKKKGEKKKSGISRFIPLFILILVLILAVSLLFRGGDTGNNGADITSGEDYAGKPKPVVTLEMESGALIKVELDPVNAPNTVKNFIDLAEAGFYDGLSFHRVIPGFMIQGGCPDGTGFSGPGYSISGEFTANGHENELVHGRGVISMARTKLPDTAGSQFFITVAERPDLDRQYAVFGTVIEGMDEVDRIVSVPTDQDDKPLEQERIRQVMVERFGVEYGPPEKI